jgi:hypothetical protein
MTVAVHMAMTMPVAVIVFLARFGPVFTVFTAASANYAHSVLS